MAMGMGDAVGPTVSGCDYKLRDDGLGIAMKGWELRAVQGKLASASELDAMPSHRYRSRGGGWGNCLSSSAGAETEGASVASLDFPMPEMIFGKSLLEVRHPPQRLVTLTSEDGPLLGLLGRR